MAEPRKAIVFKELLERLGEESGESRDRGPAEEAASRENLSQMFIGWMPFW
jgi:FATC domain